MEHHDENAPKSRESNRKRQRDEMTDGVGEQQDEQVDQSDEKPALSSENDEWSEEMHHDFVAGIFEFGLKHSSPLVLLESLQQKCNSITSEHVKSHLQKYRSAKEKNKNQFMVSYSNWLSQTQKLGIAPEETTELFLSRKLSSGEIAAYLTYVSMCGTDRDEQKSRLRKHKSESSNKTRPALASQSVAAHALETGAKEYLSRPTSGPYLLQFPQLTDQEKYSPLGESMAFIFGLASSLSRHVMSIRLQSSAINSDHPKHNYQSAMESDRVSSDPLPFAAKTMTRNDSSVSHPLSTVCAHIPGTEKQVSQHQQTAEVHGHYTSPNQDQMHPPHPRSGNYAATSQLRPFPSSQYQFLEVQHYNHLGNADFNQEHSVNSSGDRAQSNVANVPYDSSTIPDENTESYYNDGNVYPQQYQAFQPPANLKDDNR